MPTSAPSSTNRGPYARDPIAAKLRVVNWAPEVGYGRWRLGPLSVGISWPWSRGALDRLALVSLRLTWALPGNGAWKLEGAATLLGVTLGFMVGSYYANLDLRS